MTDVRRAVILSVLASALSCGGGESPEVRVEPPPPASGGLPSASVLIAHPVADFEAWKPVFDEFRPAREAGSALGHAVKRGIDDPEMVYVYSLASDLGALREHLASDELAGAMQRAGVGGEPEVFVMTPVVRDLLPETGIPGIVVIHEVESFDVWRDAYDAFDTARRGMGIVGHAVARLVDEPNRVVVYHQARSVDALRAFVESDELRGAMERAGVVGPPDIRYVEVVDLATY